MITAAQLRAARGLLDWTRNDLAKAAGISSETVKNIEHGTFRPQETTADAIIKAFALHDVVFSENEGVQKKKELIRSFIGEAGYAEFLDDIYNTVKNGGETRQFNFSDSIISTYAGQHVEDYSKKMAEVKGLNALCLVPEGDNNFPVSHCEYRWLNKVYHDNIPYFLYGTKIAMLTNEVGKDMVWVSINSSSLAQAFLKQFNTYWQQAEPIAYKNRLTR